MNQHFLFFQQFRNAEQVADITVEKKWKQNELKQQKTGALTVSGRI